MGNTPLQISCARVVISRPTMALVARCAEYLAHRLSDCTVWYCQPREEKLTFFLTLQSIYGAKFPDENFTCAVLSWFVFKAYRCFHASGLVLTIHLLLCRLKHTGAGQMNNCN